MAASLGVVVRLSPVLLLGSIQAVATGAPVQSYDTYKSWLVACDNTLACEAKGFGDGDGRSEMLFERSAGPDGELSVTIRADSSFALADLKVDGRAVGLHASGWTRESDADSTSLSTADPVSIKAFVAALRNGSTLTLGAVAPVPLDGLSAALLRIDERQGRIDNASAVIRTGPKRTDRVPPAPVAPHIASRPVTGALKPGEDARLIAQVRQTERRAIAKEECDKDIPLAAEAYALDGTRALVFIPCFMGAYQESSVAFVTPRRGGPSRRVIAPLPYSGNDPARGTVNVFTEASFDPKTGTLATFAKGRGLADCGMTASWIWNGKAFELSSLSLQQACGGVEPADWPTLFTSVQ